MNTQAAPGSDQYRTPQFTIHDRLRKAREVAGLDQSELAEVTGISRQTVGNYESGKTSRDRLKTYVVKEWAMATGVPYSWIAWGEEPEEGGPDVPPDHAKRPFR